MPGMFALFRHPAVFRGRGVLDLRIAAGQLPAWQLTAPAAPVTGHFIYGVDAQRSEALRRRHIADDPGLAADIIHGDLVKSTLPKQADRRRRDCFRQFRVYFRHRITSDIKIDFGDILAKLSCFVNRNREYCRRKGVSFFVRFREFSRVRLRHRPGFAIVTMSAAPYQEPHLHSLYKAPLTDHSQGNEDHSYGRTEENTVQSLRHDLRPGDGGGG